VFSSRFWKLSAERAVKTFAQVLASVLVAGGVGLFDANWLAALSTAAMAAVVSVLTSLGSLKIGPEDSPSIVADAPVPAPAPTTSPVPTPSSVAPLTEVAAPVPLAAAA
jgi:r1t holin